MVLLSLNNLINKEMSISHKKAESIANGFIDVVAELAAEKVLKKLSSDKDRCVPIEDLCHHSLSDLKSIKSKFYKEHEHKIYPPYLDNLLVEAYAPYREYYDKIDEEIQRRAWRMFK